MKTAIGPQETIKNKNLKIIIADDDPPTRILLRAAVGQWGYQANEVCDGQEAWDLLQKIDEPCLIILDWVMPKLDGITLCARIRKELPYHHYIVLLTQVTGTTNIVKGLEAGADEFLSKPFNMAELHSRLNVGSRIISYEHKVAKQKEQLQQNISQTVTLNSLLLNLIQKIDEVLTINANSNEHTQYREKLQELRGGLEHISQVIKKFNTDLPE